MNILLYINYVICVIVIAIIFIALRDAIAEKEKRATKIFLSLGVVGIMLMGGLLFVFKDEPKLGYILPIFTVIILFLFVLKRPPKLQDYSYSETLVDERDIMFSRAELENGTERHKTYYARKPNNLILDDKFRSYPGLLSKTAPFYHKAMFAKAQQNFTDVKKLHPLVNLPAEAIPSETIPDDPIAFLAQEAINLGAHSVGSTVTQNHHWYSIKGRGKEYGIPITEKLPYALAFTTEMDYSKVQKAPKAEIVMESSQQYLNSGKIAIALAKRLRSWGYEARAHIDGNYQVICPVVARDAGLGEIGRMGLLMTPKLGPRVRIAVVTTNMKLPSTKARTNFRILSFCEKCKICADFCPSQAIPSSSRKNIHGSLRWQINQEKCFTLWCKFGTDCGVCMKQCPYSHPNTLSHRLVRYGINHSETFQSMALFFEKWIYKKSHHA